MASNFDNIVNRPYRTEAEAARIKHGPDRNVMPRTGYIAVYQDRHMRRLLMPGADVYETREAALKAAELVRKTQRYNIWIANIEIEDKAAHSWDIGDACFEAAMAASRVVP